MELLDVGGHMQVSGFLSQHGAAVGVRKYDVVGRYSFDCLVTV